MKTLARLVGDVDRFINEVWTQRYARFHADELAELFPLDRADELLTTAVLPAPHFARVARKQAGATTNRQPYRTVSSDQNGQHLTVLEPVECLLAFDEGHTLVFQSLRDLDRRVGQFAEQLESEVGHRVGFNAYLTPKQAQGLDVHYDTHDVFVIQTHGVKHWEVWPATVQLPTSDHRPHQHEPAGEPDRFMMTPGDVLYLPRGAPHRAVTHGEASLHSTVSIHTVTGFELVQRAARRLREADDPLVRRSLPLGFHRDVAALEALTKSILQEVAEALVDVSSAEIASSLLDDIGTRPKTERGRLIELAIGSSRRDARYQQGTHCAHLQQTEQGWGLHTGAEFRPLPVACHAGLERLVSGETLSAQELVEGVSEEVGALLVEQLVRHGIASPV